MRCNVDSKVSRVAWLNRTTILFAGSEKWSLDPRVILMENTAVTEYSIKIQNVDVHDEGPYVCSILTNKKPKSTKVHLIVQEHGGDFRRLVVILGELDRAVEGPQAISKTDTCSFVQGGTG
ncbi:hypothetical protein L3Q82_021976 [Scortum barcoo]|uniref:Uncharacterized protein n=1 Tax=Scortum barcoo TaxID=214431 RepID=A0ACB8X1X2_9TELE|nr:hypothetical protein L3Q82_021976 [Scortum barcoo]